MQAVGPPMNQARCNCLPHTCSGLMSLRCCTGDQADQKLLDKILADSKAFGGYDIIIDDGGHTVNQMLTSIKVRPPLFLLQD